MFRRAIERGNYLVAVTTARELGQLSLDEALELLLLIVKKEPGRFDRAAARWHAGSCSRRADQLGAVARLDDVALRVQLETIALLAERYKVSSVAGVARRRLSRPKTFLDSEAVSAVWVAIVPECVECGGPLATLRRGTLAARSCRPVRVRSRRLPQARLVLPELRRARVREPLVESEARPAASPSPPRFIYRFRRMRPLGTGSLGGESFTLFTALASRCFYGSELLPTRAAETATRISGRRFRVPPGAVAYVSIVQAESRPRRESITGYSLPRNSLPIASVPTMTAPVVMSIGGDGQPLACLGRGMLRRAGETRSGNPRRKSEDSAKGNHPGFARAEAPERAAPLVECFCDELRALGVTLETGVFGARMQVELVNDGPVTITRET